MSLSIKELKERVKSKKKESTYVRVIIRGLSVYLTWLFIRTPLTGNHVTLLFVFFGMLGGICFAYSDPLYSLAGLFLTQLSYLIDFVDGEIARHREDTSITGSYFDKIAHILVNPVIFVGLGFGEYIRTQELFYMIIGFVAAHSCIIIECVNKFMKYKVLYSFLKHHHNIAARYHSLSDIESKPLVTPRLFSYSENNAVQPGLLRSIKGKIVNLVLQLNTNPSMFNVLSIVVILDICKIKPIFFYKYEISWIGITLSYYAIFFTLNWIKTMSSVIIQRDVDRQYKEMVNFIRSSEI
jgi:phosphatidylglycerophosphate synthase